MTIGIVTRAANSAETFRATGRAFRVIYTRQVAAGESGSHPLPGFGAHNAAAFCCLINGNDRTYGTAAASMESGRVVWEVDPITPSQFRRPGQLVVVGYA